MSKTIKVIDLLNKIANGEEVPKKIKYDNDVFNYVKHWEQYVKEDTKKPLLKIISDYNYSGLNNTVEIIEEEPEIDIQGIEELPEYLHIGDKQEEDVKDKTNIKINELIRAIKQIDKQIKEKTNVKK